mgnify:CR=1 FL=1
MDDEDLIQREDMVVTVSHLGYVKRVPLSTYRAQRRGGKGRAGMQTREEDFVSRLFVASTHTPVLFFSSHGRVYKEKVWRLPQAAPQARIQNARALRDQLIADGKLEIPIAATYSLEDVRDAYRELEERLHEELDYVNEAKNIALFQKMFRDDDEVIIRACWGARRRRGPRLNS